MGLRQIIRRLVPRTGNQPTEQKLDSSEIVRDVADALGEGVVGVAVARKDVGHMMPGVETVWVYTESGAFSADEIEEQLRVEMGVLIGSVTNVHDGDSQEPHHQDTFAVPVIQHQTGQTSRELAQSW